MSPYVSVPTRLRSSSGYGVDWRTGVDLKYAGSFTHNDKLLSYPWGRDPWGTRNISFVSRPYSFPQHCMPYDSPLEQGCYLIFLRLSIKTHTGGILVVLCVISPSFLVSWGLQNKKELYENFPSQ